MIGGYITFKKIKIENSYFKKNIPDSMYSSIFIIVSTFNFLWIISAIHNSQINIIIEGDTRIYSVPKKIQYQRMKEEKVKCIQMIIKENNETESTNSTKTCPTTSDNVSCWPKTIAGTIITRPCPNYMDRFKVDGTVIKECLITGKWYSKRKIPWTNYLNCVPKNDTNKLMHSRIIGVIGQFGYAVSIISLVLASAIFSCFRRLNCERNKMHVNLFVSFLLRALFYYVNLNNYQKRKTPSSNNNLVICRVIKTAQNYAILTNNTCVFVEAAYLHNILFYHTFTTSRTRLYYYISVAWISPSVVTLVWVILRIQFDNNFCWDAHDDLYKRDFWVIQVFSIILTLGNVLLFANLMRSIYSKMRAQPIHEVAFTRRIAQSIGVLVIAFGVYNLVFIPIDIATAVSSTNSYFNSLNLIKLYFEHLISSCQGLLVSILFCFIHSEVHVEIKRWIYRKLHYYPNSSRMQTSLLPKRCAKREFPGTLCIANGIQTEN